MRLCGRCRVQGLGFRVLGFGKGNSSSHGARPVPRIITMIKRIRTSRMSIKNSRFWVFGLGLRVWGLPCVSADGCPAASSGFEAPAPRGETRCATIASCSVGGGSGARGAWSRRTPRDAVCPSDEVRRRRDDTIPSDDPLSETRLLADSTRGAVESVLPPGKVDVRLTGKGNSNSHGARPVY